MGEGVGAPVNIGHFGGGEIWEQRDTLAESRARAGLEGAEVGRGGLAGEDEVDGLRVGELCDFADDPVEALVAFRGKITDGENDEGVARNSIVEKFFTRGGANGIGGGLKARGIDEVRDDVPAARVEAGGLGGFEVERREDLDVREFAAPVGAEEKAVFVNHPHAE